MSFCYKPPEVCIFKGVDAPIVTKSSDANDSVMLAEYYGYLRRNRTSSRVSGSPKVGESPFYINENIVAGTREDGVRPVPIQDRLGCKTSDMSNGTTIHALV